MTNKGSLKRVLVGASLYAILAGSAAITLSGCSTAQTGEATKAASEEPKARTIPIKGLDVMVTLPPGNNYRVEYVSDVGERCTELISQYRRAKRGNNLIGGAINAIGEFLDQPIKSKEMHRKMMSQLSILDNASGSTGIIGRYLPLSPNESKVDHFVVIGIEPNIETQMYATCYANSLFISALGQQNLIYEKFTEPAHVKSCIGNNSDFAALCGILGLRMAKILGNYEVSSSEKKETERDEVLRRNSAMRELVTKYYK